MTNEVKEELLGVAIAAVKLKEGAIFDGDASFLVWVAVFTLVERASSYNDLDFIAVLRRVFSFVENVLVGSNIAIDDLIAIAWLHIIVDDRSCWTFWLILAVLSTSLSK